MTIVEQEVAPEVVTERERRARVLEAAALEIDVRGWVQAGREAMSGEVCIAGAAGFSSGGNANLECYMALGSAWFGTRSYESWCEAREEVDAIVSWNDVVATTADDVTFLLRWRAEEIRDGR